MSAAGGLAATELLVGSRVVGSIAGLGSVYPRTVVRFTATEVVV